MHFKLNDICTIIAGQSPESKYYNTEGNGMPFFQGKADFGDLYPTIRVYCSEPIRVAEKDDILLSVRAPVGATNLAPCKVCIGRGLTAIRPFEQVNLRYLLHFFRYFEAQLQRKGTGTTFKAITQAVVKEIEVPVPPLEEQARIVARIEELFSQLESGVETLKQTKEQLALYEQIVLRDAFDSIIKQEKLRKVKEICKDIKVGIVIKPTQYYVTSNGVRAFRNANVRRGFVEDKDWIMISEQGHKQNVRSIVHTGDVLISRSGVNLGMATALPAQYDGYNAIDIVIAVPDQSQVLPKYLAAFTNSPYGRSIVKEKQRGVGQGHLNVSAYGSLNIPIPHLDKQQQLINRIDDKLSSCEAIEQTVDTALQQAEALRQSILKKAFEGGL